MGWGTLETTGYRKELLDHIREAGELVNHRERQFSQYFGSYEDLIYARARLNGLMKALEIWDNL